MITAADVKPSYDELTLENEKLRVELAYLKRLIFGQKRERFIPVRNDSQIIMSEVAQIAATDPKPVTETIRYTRNKPTKGHPTPHGRQALPAHLPRKEITILPEQNVTGLKKIRDEITEVLEYKPGSFFVIKYIRPIFAMPEEEGCLIGKLPSRPIDKGIAGPGLLAEILINKYIDHLPLYRQWKKFQRQDIDIAVSTMSGWVQACAELLKPLYELQKKQIIQSSYIMADETTIKVLDREKKGKTHSGYYWVYYSPLLRQVFFDYRDGRGRAGPLDVLEKFKGYVQSDGYAGYEALFRRPDVVPVACMAHARRNFFETQPENSPLRLWILERIQSLYEIERRARELELSHQNRHALRQSEAVPVLNEIETWLHENCIKVLPKSEMSKAIGYMMNRWDRLCCYVSDGRLEIDNNLVENAIRPIALGRKNYLFAGSHDGAQRAAIIYTMVANAGLAEKKPFEYLRDVLSRIADHPYHSLSELLACNWQPLPDQSE